MAAPKRIQLRRMKGWRLPPWVVSVARPSRWGNPYVIGSGEIKWTGLTSGPGAGFYNPRDEYHGDLVLPGELGVLTRWQSVALYRMDLLGSLADYDPFYDELRAALDALRGHDLACWCALADPCHADVLLELANGQRQWSDA